MPVHQHPAAFPPPRYCASRPAHAPHGPRQHGQTCAGSRTSPRRLAPKGDPGFPSAKTIISNHNQLIGKTSDDRCPEKRHSVRYLWIPVGVLGRKCPFGGGGIHFYCVGGRFCGHLSFEAGRTLPSPTGQARARREPFRRARAASSGSRRKTYIPAAVPQTCTPHPETHSTSHPGSGAALSCARR
jgi:hypothetical protein